MKGIGAFVSVLLIVGGVAMYLYTRPPDRRLDRPGQAWVDEFTAWSAGMRHTLDRAEVSIGVSRGERLDRSLLPDLESCRRTLGRLGRPPVLLERARVEARTACAEVEHGLAVYARYGPAALASTERHLKRASGWLTAAELTIQRRLNPDEPL